MGKIEDKIMSILNRPLVEEVEYEVVGGPTPGETLKGPLDYAKNVKQAHVPTAPGSSAGALETPGVGEIGSDEADENDEVDVEMSESDEDDEDDKDEMSESDESDDDEDDDKDDIDETFASLLARLAEEDDDEDDEDKDLDEDEDEILPTVDSELDSPEKLVTKGPGVEVAEGEDDDDEDDEDKDLDEDEDEILPTVDSELDSPEKLVTKAPGVEVAEGEDDEDDEDDDKKKDDVSEDIRAIFAGTKLSEKAQDKATTIFKAAVTRRVNEEKNRVQKIATKKLQEAFAILKSRTAKKNQVFESNLTNKVDSYLNYVVENWMSENRLAVERGIRAELAEDFIKGLKNLFVEHYIEVPDSKVDVVATLGKKVTKLESKLNEAVETNIKMRSSLASYRKEEVIRVVGAGLADTQKDKLNRLAEGVEYTSRKDFADKLVSLKESYFPKAAKPKREERLVEEKAPKATKSEMDVYTSTISKFKKN